MPNKITLLQQLRDEVDIIASQLLEFEEWDATYLTQKDLLARLIRSERKTEDEVYKAFREWSERIPELVNVSEIEKRIRKEKKYSVLEPIAESAWSEFNKRLALALALGVVDALSAGGEHSERELNVDIGWNSETEPASKWLEKYSLDLVKDLSKTTRDRMSAQINLGIKLGEDLDAVTSRLEKVIKDRNRAKLIGQTESVRAYTAGRLMVGNQIGATEKTWSSIIDNRTSNICRSNDGRTIPFEEFFEDLYGRPIEGPPAHPRCRSGLKIAVIKK